MNAREQDPVDVTSVDVISVDITSVDVISVDVEWKRPIYFIFCQAYLIFCPHIYN